MGPRKRWRQHGIFIEPTRLRTAEDPFYQRLNAILKEHGFDDFVEQLCAKFYDAKQGRPSIAPGVYFRMLLIGYFEGIDSEREIAWRSADSLALREFLGFELNQSPPDHSIRVPNAAAAGAGDAQAGVPVDTRGAGERGSGRRQDSRGRCDDAGSQRRVAFHRAARQR